MFSSFHIDGVNAFNENNYDRAKRSFLRAIDKNPDVAESYFYLGKCYFFLDEKKQAISPLKKFIDLMKHNSDEVANISYGFDLLGQCYEAKNKDTNALRCYETATKIYPGGASAWNNMGLLYIKSALSYLKTDLDNSAKLFISAKVFIKKALEICSNYPVFLHSLASWYEQYIRFLKKFKKVVEDNEAVQKSTVSNFSKAIQSYRTALSACHEEDLALKGIILSNLTECLAQYGHHWYKNKNYKKAQETYLEVLHLDPGHLVVINQIGMSFFKQNCFPEAREYFSSILDKTQDEEEIADAYLNIACTYSSEEEWKKANQDKKCALEGPSISEEDMKGKESKWGTLLISTPKTLFGHSNAASQSTGNKEVEDSIFQLS